MPSYYAEHILKLKQAKIKVILTEDEKNKILNSFEHLVCKITKEAIIIKHEKFGYELFHSKSDNKFWSYAVTFTEPLDPVKPIYKHHWIGNAFIGYGYDTLEETINQTRKMMEQGPTASTNFRDYLVDWDETKFRISLDWEEKEWSFEKYLKFQRWFQKNKIRIMAKQVGIKDAEDYNKESNNTSKSALSVLLGKMQDPPKRPRSMVVVMRNPTKTNQKWDDPKSKKFIVGFMYVN